MRININVCCKYSYTILEYTWQCKSSCQVGQYLCPAGSASDSCMDCKGSNYSKCLMHVSTVQHCSFLLCSACADLTFCRYEHRDAALACTSLIYPKLRRNNTYYYHMHTHMAALYGCWRVPQLLELQSSSCWVGWSTWSLQQGKIQARFW